MFKIIFKKKEEEEEIKIYFISYIMLWFFLNKGNINM